MGESSWVWTGPQGTIDRFLEARLTDVRSGETLAVSSEFLLHVPGAVFSHFGSLADVPQCVRSIARALALLFSDSGLSVAERNLVYRELLRRFAEGILEVEPWWKPS